MALAVANSDGPLIFSAGDDRAVDVLLSGAGLLAPFVEHWQREATLLGVSAADHGRPTIAIETYVQQPIPKASNVQELL